MFDVCSNRPVTVRRRHAATMRGTRACVRTRRWATRSARGRVVLSQLKSTCRGSLARSRSTKRLNAARSLVSSGTRTNDVSPPEIRAGMRRRSQDLVGRAAGLVFLDEPNGLLKVGHEQPAGGTVWVVVLREELHARGQAAQLLLKSNWPSLSHAYPWSVSLLLGTVSATDAREICRPGGGQAVQLA